MTTWVPAVRTAVVTEQVPPASVQLALRGPPFANWTVPVAVPGVTVAVNVTVPPKADGFGVEVRARVEVALTTSCPAVASEVAREASPR